MELEMAMVEERKYEKSEEHEEDEEFAKVFNTTTFEFEVNEEFDKVLHCLPGQH
jgi:hypothetical protein